MKLKKITTGTVPKAIETEATSIFLIYIHACSLPVFGTGTSIKSGAVKLSFMHQKK